MDICVSYPASSSTPEMHCTFGVYWGEGGRKPPSLTLRTWILRFRPGRNLISPFDPLGTECSEMSLWPILGLWRNMNPWACVGAAKICSWCVAVYSAGLGEGHHRILRKEPTLETARNKVPGDLTGTIEPRLAWSWTFPCHSKISLYSLG